MRFSFEQNEFIECEISPNKWAILAEDENLTWTEFQKRVNDCCINLKQYQLDQQEHPLIIYGHKEASFVIAVYACIKLNITYIPIDIIYPVSRIESIINQAEVKCIINCSASILELKGLTQIEFNRNNFKVNSSCQIEKIKTTKEDPTTYIIFTSGSTGEPKGVQITKEAIISFSNWMTQDFGFSSEDVFINVALFSFDLSVYELISFASIGASIILNSKHTVDKPELFIQKINKHKGTIWVSTPSYAFVYSRMENQMESLKYFLFCGEILSHALAKSLKTNFPNVKILNTYGPTEATVATTLVEIDESLISRYNPLPVGFPKKDSRIEIINDEIVISGKHVSIGYVKRPELNKEKFYLNNGIRAFKTGDYGYFEENMLFCKGRNDDQVKLHGYRIELNEITAKILEFNQILQAVTIALKRNEEVKKIVSLIQIKNDIDFELSHLTSFLKDALPHYMIPSDIKIVTNIPLNQNGKADKKLIEQIYLGKN